MQRRRKGTIERLEGRRLFDALPQARLFAETSSGGEGLPDAVVRVVLDQPAPTQLDINYTLSGSASAGTDYAALPGFVRIAAGATEGVLRFTAIDDAVSETLEQINVQLVAQAGYALGPTASQTTVIRYYDNDLPVAGTPVATTDNPATWNYTGTAASSSSIVAVTGMPFTTARRISNTAAPEAAWEITVEIPNDQPVAYGSTMLLGFYARSNSPTAQLAAVVEQAQWPYYKTALQSYSLTSADGWTHFQIAARAEMDFGTTLATNLMHLAFQLGYDSQSLEIGGISWKNLGTSVDAASLYTTESSYLGRAGDASWRAEAQARIDQYRKGDLQVVVKDAAGNLVPGATVHAKQIGSDFGFGTAVSAWRIVDDYDPNSAIYREKIPQLFNKAVMDYGMIEKGWADSYGQQAVVDSIAWLSSQGITDLRGHNAVYPLWDKMAASDGDTYKGINYRSDPNLEDSYEEFLAHQTADGYDAAVVWLKQKFRTHLQSIMSDPRLIGKFKDWDVVNEPWPTQFEAGGIIGQAEMIDLYRLARLADPSTRLFVNDYPNAIGGEQLEGDYSFLQAAQQAGAPVDGFGFQSHFFTVGDADIDKIYSTFNRFASLGVKLQVTEFDYVATDEQLQADFLRDYMTLAFSTPAMDAFTQWGFWDGQHWRPGAGLFRQDWSLRPNGQQFIDLVKSDWTTDATLTTSASGGASVRGFTGKYELTVTLGDQTVTQVATLANAGTQVVVVLENAPPPTVAAPGVVGGQLRTQDWWHATMQWDALVTGLSQTDVIFTDMTHNVRIDQNNYWLSNEDVNGRTVSTLTFNSPLPDGRYEWAFAGGAGTGTATGLPTAPASFRFDANAAKPAISATLFDYATAQKVKLQFSELLGSIPAASSFVVTNTSTGQVVPAATQRLTYDASSASAELTFTQLLSDGRYTVALAAGLLSDTEGNASIAPFASSFFVMAGDANHDSTVNFLDLLAVGQNYLKTSATFEQGDFDYNGTVNFADLLIVAQRYQSQLPGTVSTSAQPWRKRVGSADLNSEKDLLI